MTPTERDLLLDLSMALEAFALCLPPRISPAKVAALQQRIREALAKKGKRK